MAPGNELSGIYNPMIGLGTLGLGAGGEYSSYPYTNGVYGVSYPGGYGGYGDSVFNMYQNMQNIQHNMEMVNANHTDAMNAIMNNNEVSAVAHSQSALIGKILQNSSVMALVDNLIDKVHKRELDGVCNQYQDLKNQIYATYRDEIAARGAKENPDIAVRKIIDTLYSKEMELAGVKNACLRDDIKTYGESPFMNGYQQASKPGHDKKYVDEVLYDIYREDISNVRSNEGARSTGMFVGGLANTAKKALTVGGISAVVTTGVAGIIQGTATLFGQKEPKLFKPIAKFGLHTSGIISLCMLGYGLFKSLYNSGKNEVENGFVFS